MTEQGQPTAETRSMTVAKFQKETIDQIQAQIATLDEAGALQLPKDYAVGNQLKLAWLRLLETKTSKAAGERPVLEACTKESIANALLEMVIQGLSIAKKQVAFVAYGDRLTLQREYHGTIALALRVGGVADVPTGAVVYKDDDFDFVINPATGRRQIIKHGQKLANIDPDKIIAAYAVIPLTNGQTHVEIMTMQQIKQAWMQGATKGQSPAHRNFPDQMAIKTVIGRGCKLFISSSSDAGILGNSDEQIALPEAKPGADQPVKQISMKAKQSMLPEPEDAQLVEEPKATTPEQPATTADENPAWAQ